MLRAILNPRERWALDKDRGKEFITSLTEWGLSIADYERQSSEVVTDNIRLSTVLEHALSPCRELLLQASPDARSSYSN
eukprot:10587805-Lingulodinium_polyedra.AAC.1